MLLSVLILILVTVAILTLYFRKVSYKFPSIIAGEVEGLVTVGTAEYIRRFDIFLYKNRLFNYNRDFMGTINGTSMLERGLKPGDIVFGSKYLPESKLKAGDLIIIEITDKNNPNFGRLKIREFENYGEHNLIHTCKYVKGRKVTSRPHRLGDIRAVVDHYLCK